MPLKSGTRLGPYEIAAPLGEGGMGEVYRARDTRLDRAVAIKILPERLAGNAEARQRFEREARAISALSHSNICTLYDVGSDNGTDFLVMELLEGETLADRLLKGPVPLEQVFRYGIEICEALARAHRSGVLHRDLKPGNIMLCGSGVKLMDFGLAKPLAGSSPASGLSATLTHGSAASPVTAQGTVVGTFQYMAPEQVEGREADTHTDIFALGAVLYEMATGKRAFEGKTTASVIAAILEREPPPISQLQPMSPPELDLLVKQCLAKDPEERLQSVHDVKLQLKWMSVAGTAAQTDSAPSKRQPRQTAAWSLAAICLLLAIGFALAYFLRTPQALPMIRSSVLPPAGSSFKSLNFAISPDGTRLAFVATENAAKDRLWVRFFPGGSAQPLAGTDDAMYPFWAPDSRHIGFFADGKLKTVDTGGGSVRVLCDARQGWGGAWNRDGVILFEPDNNGPLYKISDTGGAPTAATKLTRVSSQAHRWPYFLPDGKRFLFNVDWSSPEDGLQNGLYVGSLDGSAPKLISAEIEGNVALASGYLLYGQGASLMAQAFDASRLEFNGPAVAIAEEEVGASRDMLRAAFSVSQDGLLVFQSLTDSTSYFGLVDAKGNEVNQLKFPGAGHPRFSPDGRFLVFDSDDDRNGKSYIRVYDFGRGIATRLTEGGKESNPIWSQDGRRIAYIETVPGSSSIYEVAADGSGSPQLLFQRNNRMLHIDWSRKGELAFANFVVGLPRLDFYSPTDHEVKTFASQGAEGRFSPDGKWLAYNSKSIIYVQPFPGPGGRTQISNGSGAQPVWSRDGRHLFYVTPDKKLMEVDFDPRSGTAGAPRIVLQTRIIAPAFVGTQYDVAPDGKFLINSVSAERASPLTLLSNWTAAVARK